MSLMSFPEVVFLSFCYTLVLLLLFLPLRPPRRVELFPTPHFKATMNLLEDSQRGLECMKYTRSPVNEIFLFLSSSLFDCKLFPNQAFLFFSPSSLQRAAAIPRARSEMIASRCRVCAPARRAWGAWSATCARMEARWAWMAATTVIRGSAEAASGAFKNPDARASRLSRLLSITLGRLSFTYLISG